MVAPRLSYEDPEVFEDETVAIGSNRQTFDDQGSGAPVRLQPAGRWGRALSSSSPGRSRSRGLGVGFAFDAFGDCAQAQFAGDGHDGSGQGAPVVFAEVADERPVDSEDVDGQPA